MTPQPPQRDAVAARGRRAAELLRTPPPLEARPSLCELLHRVAEEQGPGAAERDTADALKAT